jgi:ribosomal protein S12 methylthiotransferase accessory factor
VSLAPSTLRGSFQRGSNGLASGNAFVEAVCAGLAEVIERDAVTCALLRVGGDVARLPTVDLATVPNDRVRELVGRLAGAGVAPILLDCTCDSDVPTYMAVLVDDAPPAPGCYRGCGAHLDPDVAMTRALTEAIQSRAIHIAGSRDDLSALDHARLRRRQDRRLIAVARARVGPRAAPRLSSATESFEGDCHALVGALTAIGLEQVVVVDLTRPDFAIPVVRVLVPGLEGPIDADHYAPGRRGRAAMAEAERP